MRQHPRARKRTAQRWAKREQKIWAICPRGNAVLDASDAYGLKSKLIGSFGAHPAIDFTSNVALAVLFGDTPVADCWDFVQFLKSGGAHLYKLPESTFIGSATCLQVLANMIDTYRYDLIISPSMMESYLEKLEREGEAELRAPSTAEHLSLAHDVYLWVLAP